MVCNENEGNSPDLPHAHTTPLGFICTYNIYTPNNPSTSSHNIIIITTSTATPLSANEQISIGVVPTCMSSRRGRGGECSGIEVTNHIKAFKLHPLKRSKGISCRKRLKHTGYTEENTEYTLMFTLSRSSLGQATTRPVAPPWSI